MKTESLAGRYVPTPDEVKGPGDFSFEDFGDGMFLLRCVLPGEIRYTEWFCGKGFKPKGEAYDYSWEWDGNEEKPTLRPSLHHHEQWHGRLENGQFVSDG